MFMILFAFSCVPFYFHDFIFIFMFHILYKKNIFIMYKKNIFFCKKNIFFHKKNIFFFHKKKIFFHKKKIFFFHKKNIFFLCKKKIYVLYGSYMIYVNILGQKIKFFLFAILTQGMNRATMDSLYTLFRIFVQTHFFHKFYLT